MILIGIISIFLLITPLSAADENNTQNTIITSGESPASDNEKRDVYIKPDKFTGIYGNNETPILVYAYDENNESVTEGTVTLIDVFGEDYTIHLENGIGGRYIFCKETGTFNITCKYTGTGKYNNATTTLTLYVPVANTTCHNIVATKYDNCVYFTGNVVSDYREYEEFQDFEEVTEGNLTIYIDGENMGMCKVDANGNFFFIYLEYDKKSYWPTS